MEIMINHVVLMFFPTDEKTPNEQGGNRTVIRFKSVAVRSIVHKGDVTRDDSQRRFLAQRSVAICSSNVVII